jgi:hypothetical protein
MQLADFTGRCRKATLTRLCAGLGLWGPALVAWPSSAAAQDAASQDRVTAAVLAPEASGNETSTARPFEAVRTLADDSITPADIANPTTMKMPDAQIVVAPARVAEDEETPSQTFQSVGLDSAVIHDRNIPGVTRVTSSETPASACVTGVTLWDEIVPPTPPVPVGDAQTVPGGVASSEGE